MDKGNWQISDLAGKLECADKRSERSNKEAEGVNNWTKRRARRF
jgi:hypothetical protein